MRLVLVAGVALAALCAAAALAHSPSDRRLKRDVRAVAPSTALEVVTRLEPVTFYWSEDQVIFPQGGRRVGLIAQEVAEVLPEVVEDRGGFLYVAFDDLTAVLIAATQQQQQILLEQEARIDEQLALIQELERRLETLEGELP